MHIILLWFFSTLILLVNIIVHAHDLHTTISMLYLAAEF